MKEETSESEYYQSIQDAGRKLKLSAKIDISLLRMRNYDQSEEDSIDISDIIDDRQRYFDPFTLLHNKMPENIKELRQRNYNLSQTDEEDSFQFDEIEELEQKEQKERKERQDREKNDEMQKNQKREVKEEREEREGNKERKDKIAEAIEVKVEKDILKTEIKQEFFNVQVKEEDKKIGQLSFEIPTKEVVQISQKISEQNESVSRHSQNSSDHGNLAFSGTEIENKKSKRLRRIRSNRKETFSKDLIETLMATFKVMKSENIQQQVADLSERFSLGIHLLLRMYQEWQSDPTMAKYTNNVEEPLGALVKGKRMRTHLRIKHIHEMLQHNPYLTQRQISDKLFEIDKSKKRVLRSAIIRLLKISGYKRKKIEGENTPQLMSKVKRQRKEFMIRYRQISAKKGEFYFLGECLFHKYIGVDTFWSKDKQIQPKLSKKFIAESMLLVAFLSPTGNLYWEVRGGDYQLEEYTDLLTKMLKKMGGKKNGSHQNVNAVIISESKLRDFQINRSIVDKSGGIPLKTPRKSIPMNPLETLFEDLKQKIKKYMNGSQQQAIKNFSEIARGIKKSDLLILIDNSKKYLQMAEKEESF